MAAPSASEVLAALSLLLPRAASRTWLMGIDLGPFKPSSNIKERRAGELVPSGQEKNDEREMGNK